MRLLARSNQLLLYLRVHKRLILRLPSRDPCIDAMPDWWCVVSGHGYYECPAELAKTMRRGSRIKAAAWRLPVTRDAEFHFAIAAEIQKCDDEAAARRRFHIDFNKKNGSFGTKLQSCPKIEVLNVYRAPDAACFQIHFHDFAVIRDDFAVICDDFAAASTSVEQLRDPEVVASDGSTMDTDGGSAEARRDSPSAAPSASATAVDHLYLLRYPWDESPIKVGRAHDVDARVRNLESGHNFKLQQLAIFPGQGRLERRVHTLLSDHRATDGRGQEWFHVTLEQAAAAATSAIALATPPRP